MMDPFAVRSRKKERNGIVLALLILVFTAIWIAAGERSATEDLQGSTPLRHDMDKLWAWADSALEGGAEAASWSFRWDGRSGGDGIAGLAQSLRLSAVGLSLSGNVNTIKELDEGSIRLWYSPDVKDANGEGSLVLILEGMAGKPYNALTGIIAKAEDALKEQHISVAPSLSFRGVAKKGKTLASIVKSSGATLQEHYEDGNTVSETYYSGQLTIHVESGGRDVNLQIAESNDPETGKRRLIAGIPLITGDYFFTTDQ